MKAEDVARYLQDNPEFFENYAEMLAQINLPHPHGGRAIPIAERQILTLREKQRAGGKLRELIQFGEENDAMRTQSAPARRARCSARDLQPLLQALVVQPARGSSPCRMSRCICGEDRRRPESAEVLAFADQRQQPVCCASCACTTPLPWFGEAAAHLRSFACICRCATASLFGMLALASEDAQRFYPEMGTLYPASASGRTGQRVRAVL